MVNSEGVIIRELFKTPPTFGLRVSVLAIIALLCVFLDHSGARFHAYRQQAEIVVHPMRLLVDKPIEWVYQATQDLTLQRDLIRENDQLRIKEIILQSQVQQLLELQRENNQLKALLSSSSGVTGRVKVANILAISMDPNLHQLILNKGHHDQVYSGQPVFDAFGVMGQVVDATRDTSKVLLITDPRTAIPVKDYRTGMRAIVEGSGDGQSLRLLNVSTLADVKTGDVFVTSGYGRHFPQGYPVGVVTQVQHHVGQQFLPVALLPSAHLDQTQRVLLVWPSQLKLRNQVKQLLEKSLPQIKAKSS
ncbi:MAG: rod shape-determining protein MreC [Coxiella sp. (in: Bacteria)]|nr:MAG: rod shape-determining protein MreC [Coxiella sp. (in: g-proteobacteria)]